MKNSPDIDVSIIVINYNTFQLTCDCIASVLEMTMATTCEIILVDNASTDKSPEEFNRLFPNLNVIISQENLGFSKGNNFGIAHAKGKYILLLNSDTVLKNDAVSIIKNFLDQNLKVAVASARLEFPDGRIQHNCQRFPSIQYQLVELFRLQKLSSRIERNLFGSFFDYNSIAYPDWVWGTFLMFRKELLQNLPGQKLADDFFMYVEDMQWCMEFRRLGFEIAFCPEAKVIHFMGGSGGEKISSMQRNHDTFMKLYYPVWKRPIIRLLNFLLTSRYAA